MTPQPASRVSPETMFSGLYVILDETWASRCSLVEVLRQAGDAGVKLAQYRNKTGSMKQAYMSALTLRDVAAELSITFIINDRCDLALAVEANGIHLGQTDLPISLARKIVGERTIIGVSTHNPEQVRTATNEGADYIGYGPIFHTGTKSNLEPLVGIEGVTEVRKLTALPIFAIGGITPESVPALRAAGATGVAVASAILDASDRPRLLSRFVAAFE